MQCTVIERRQIGMAARMGLKAEPPSAQFTYMRHIHQGIGGATGVTVFTPGIALTDQLTYEKHRGRPAECCQYRRRELMHAEEAN